jgi:hypothetical protein
MASPSEVNQVSLTSKPLHTGMLDLYNSNGKLQQQWYYRKEAFANTPSVTIDGFSVKKEKEDRAKGCNFIQSVGMTLKL